MSAFPLGPLSPHVMGMLTPPHPYPLLPIHHPASPLHHPAQAGMMMTPGLPPITPSMPSFTFFPQMSPHMPPATPEHYPHAPVVSVHPAVAMAQMGVLSPGLPFSPGVAVTPGNFWGAGGAGAYINPAVGAPVHRPGSDEGAGQPPQQHGYFPPVRDSASGGTGSESMTGSGSTGRQLEPSQEQGYFPPMAGVGLGVGLVEKKREGVPRNKSGGSSVSDGTPSNTDVGSSREGPSPVSTATTWYDEAQSALLANGLEGLALAEREREKARTYSAGSHASAGRPSMLGEKGRAGSDPAPGAPAVAHVRRQSAVVAPGAFGAAFDLGGGPDSAPSTMQRPEAVMSPFHPRDDVGGSQKQQPLPWGSLEHMRSY
jgi:hypothetical protein